MPKLVLFEYRSNRSRYCFPNVIFHVVYVVAAWTFHRQAIVYKVTRCRWIFDTDLIPAHSIWRPALEEAGSLENNYVKRTVVFDDFRVGSAFLENDTPVSGLTRQCPDRETTMSAASLPLVVSVVTTYLTAKYTTGRREANGGAPSKQILTVGVWNARTRVRSRSKRVCVCVCVGEKDREREFIASVFCSGTLFLSALKKRAVRCIPMTVVRAATRYIVPSGIPLIVVPLSCRPTELARAASQGSLRGVKKPLPSPHLLPDGENRPRNSPPEIDRVLPVYYRVPECSTFAVKKIRRRNRREKNLQVFASRHGRRLKRRKLTTVPRQQSERESHPSRTELSDP